MAFVSSNEINFRCIFGICYFYASFGLITSLFTSQIFGNLIFYAPFNLVDIKTMKYASIISIFIEHLPQLIVQCFVLFVVKTKHSWTLITIASLFVSIIDTFLTVVKILIWFVIMQNMKMV